MATRGKHYRSAAEKVEPLRLYEPAEAVRLVKEMAYAKFDESVEAHIRTGLDPRHADQMIRGSVTLPSGTGKVQRVVVFAQGEKAREAEEAGADVVGAEDLVQRVQGGWMEFDVAVATPEMMSAVGRLGKVLGPRGLMPTPRTGTVTPDVGRAVRDIKGGRIEFRLDKTGVIHVGLGKVSFPEENVLKNLGALIDAVVRAKPTGAKGQYLRSVSLASSMSPGVKLELGATLALASAER